MGAEMDGLVIHLGLTEPRLSITPAISDLFDLFSFDGGDR